MMYPTTEVRWFLRGGIQPGVWAWYEGWGPDMGEQPARVDYYLRINEGDSLGVKLREGRLEVKQQYGRRDVVRFGEVAEGIVEQWRKWSFPLAESRGVLPALDGNSSSWIGVRKERSLHTFQVVADKVVAAVPGAGILDRGCGWEVAKVKIEGTEAAWWSVGFEAFGDDGERRELLFSVANQVLSVGAAPTLSTDDSYGYPRWLREAGVTAPID